MRYAAGHRLDGFEILAPLGAGGMSEVYLARDCATGLRVVVKLPNPQLLADPALFGRFQREIEIGRRLDHPNVQRILATGVLADEAAPYIVAEYVEGQSLRRYLDEHRPLPIDRALDFARQLTAALAYCHAHGVVHRDLKPENVLVTPDAHLKLMDFGIALLRGARRVTWTRLSTGAGSVGTPDYMAPEQVRGRRGDERSDVYAVGVMLFEMLAGDVPFSGDTPLAAMSARLTQETPPLRTRRADVPPAQEAVGARALHRDPAQRYPTMAALAGDLAELSPPSPSTPPVAGGRVDTSGASPDRRATAIAIAAALVILCLVGAAAALLTLGQP